MYDFLDDVPDNGLFELSGEKSWLLTISISQTKETCIFPTALGFPEYMNHRSVLALEIQGIS